MCTPTVANSPCTLCTGSMLPFTCFVRLPITVEATGRGLFEDLVSAFRIPVDSYNMSNSMQLNFMQPFLESLKFHYLKYTWRWNLFDQIPALLEEIHQELK